MTERPVFCLAPAGLALSTAQAAFPRGAGPCRRGTRLTAGDARFAVRVSGSMFRRGHPVVFLEVPAADSSGGPADRRRRTWHRAARGCRVLAAICLRAVDAGAGGNPAAREFR